MSTTEVVLARPERRRILRELLNTPEPWNKATRELYTTMCQLEMLDGGRLELADTDIIEQNERETFSELMGRGVPLERARELARDSARKSFKEYRRETSPGRRERTRRRAFNDAVTHFQGGTAVTAGLVEQCIVCGGTLGYTRRDSAYCSNRCRQAAYRKRKREGAPISAEAKQRERERQEIRAVVAKYGITPRQLNRWAKLSEIPEDELDRIVTSLPHNDETERILARYRAGA
jgi:hypothetical protein